MTPQDKFNIVSISAFVLIIIMSVFYLFRNIAESLSYLNDPIYSDIRMILSTINFFIILTLFMISLGIIFGIAQLNKGFSLKRLGNIVLITFFLNIIALIALLKVNSLTGTYLPERFEPFLGYMVVTIILNTIAFLGSLMGMIRD